MTKTVTWDGTNTVDVVDLFHGLSTAKYGLTDSGRTLIFEAPGLFIALHAGDSLTSLGGGKFRKNSDGE